ncbi:MAG: hypothetical protein IJT94_10680, partial [Oscillibacter sp.]|nr:hypothetical protein [Oscillibacter sp.]
MERKGAWRRKGRRWAALMLAVILGASALTGCGGAPQENPETEGNVETADGSGGSGGAVETVSITGLTVDGLADPLGIESEAPLFGWRMESSQTGAKQTAYQITVTDPAGTVVWDSGKVEDAASQNIAYGGEKLLPRTRYGWTLTVTDGEGTELPTREGFFETSLLAGQTGTRDAVWGGAQWIGADELYFDAATANYFSLDMTVQIPDGSTRAGIVFGADDYRLKNDAMNIWGSISGSCFCYEIDVTDAAAPKLNIYAAGMPVPGQDAENEYTEPDFTVDIP